MRRNRDGTRNKQDWSTQDHARLNLDVHGRALRAFENWAALRPKLGYYDCLPPAARMAVDAVSAVLSTLEMEKNA
jgi:hypothetical protein